MNDTQHNDSYPWTWEPAAITIILLLVIGVVAVQVGRSTALLLSGAGLWWPETQMVVVSTWAILGGDTTAGLPDHIPASTPVWLVGAMTVLTAVLMCVGCVWCAWRLRSGAVKGMATIHQAHHLLGLRRLRQTRSIIRPDLYPRRRR